MALYKKVHSCFFCLMTGHRKLRCPHPVKCGKSSSSLQSIERRRKVHKQMWEMENLVVDGAVQQADGQQNVVGLVTNSIHQPLKQVVLTGPKVL